MVITSGRVRGAVREALEALGKAALALAVFSAIFFSFQQAVTRQTNAALASMPLPDVVVQSDCAVWFVGSSSMSRWSTLQRDMSPWSTHNRSIGGATLAEISRHFLNEKKPQPPRAIVFYAGENDLSFGVSLDAAVARFRDFLRSKTERLGAVPVLFVSVKPSPTRWDQRVLQVEFNQAIRELADELPDLFYVDARPRFLVEEKPGPYFAEDGLHFNETGYRILAEEIGTALRADLPASVVNHCTSASAST